jgi:DNA primase
MDDRIPELLGRIDLCALVESYGGVPASYSYGKQKYHCPHPNHPDDDASFTVSTWRGKERFHCWSACNAQGDAIDLVMWLENVSKFEAIQLLRRRANLEWEPVARPRRPRRETARPPIQPPQPLPIGPGRDRIIARFLAERGWSQSTADALKLTPVTDAWGNPRMMFPFFLRGERVYWQARAVYASRLRWLNPTGPVPAPYEADRLLVAEDLGAVITMEGTSDTVALVDAWPDAPVIGIPGAGALKAKWAPGFAGLTVVCFADADSGGQTLRRTLDDFLSPVAKAIHHVSVPDPFKDVAEWRKWEGDAFLDAFLGRLPRSLGKGWAA